ncbi:hypothetical protein PMIN02_011328 [Paraphaeosphaeria minitans]
MVCNMLACGGPASNKEWILWWFGAVQGVGNLGSEAEVGRSRKSSGSAHTLASWAEVINKSMWVAGDVRHCEDAFVLKAHEGSTAGEESGAKTGVDDQWVGW